MDEPTHWLVCYCPTLSSPGTWEPTLLRREHTVKEASETLAHRYGCCHLCQLKWNPDLFKDLGHG